MFIGRGVSGHNFYFGKIPLFANQQSKWMRPFNSEGGMMRKKIIWSVVGLWVVVTLILNSCGGSGSSSGTTPPVITAGIGSFQNSSMPPGFPTASVTVKDGSTGADITNATAIINGVTLIYNSAVGHQAYEGNVAVSPGQAVTFTVTTGGVMYTASGAQFTSYPTISAPLSMTTWSSGSTNLVAWSGGAPKTNAVYLLGVLNANDPDGDPIWPIQAVQTTTTSYPIPSGSLTAGSRYVLVGIATTVSIPNAGSNSAFMICGFDAVPITVN